jgi:hypothetical protein
MGSKTELLTGSEGRSCAAGAMQDAVTTGNESPG